METETTFFDLSHRLHSRWETHTEPLTSAMEIEGEDGSTTHLREGSEAEFGRGKGFNTNDRTVSRRHVLFEFTSQQDHSSSQTAPRVSFEVVGKNPIWVRAPERGEIRVFRRFERGQLRPGDLFCVSCNNPVWFSLKQVDDNEIKIGEMGDALELEVSSESGSIGNGQESDLGVDSIDVSTIDPVKEFGFLVIGHEFDGYPKGMIRDAKSWNWFLEDRRQDSTDDEDDSYDKGKKHSRRKRKKADKEEDDEEWTGDSKDEEVLAKAKKPHAPKYKTRSKDLTKGRPTKDSGSRKGYEEEDRADEEGDETLGGFIVGEKDVEEEIEQVGEDEDEEE